MFWKRSTLFLLAVAFVGTLMAACLPVSSGPVVVEVTRPAAETAAEEVVEVTRVVTVTEAVTPTALPTATQPTPTASPTATATPTPLPPTPLPPPPPTPTVLDYNLPANYESVPAVGSFEVAMTSGGDIDVNGLYLGSGCTGFATSAPDYELNWSGNSDELHILFAADHSGEDTTLIVNDPFGNWRCNDDFDARDPGIIFSDPVQGTYDIWVGSYHEGDFINGRLHIAEVDLVQGLDYALPTNYGSLALSSGFLPDPVDVGITSGGEVNVGELGLGAGCIGHASAAPDYEVEWSGNSDDLRFFFVAGGGYDTTLIINDPYGNWHCNDDFDGLDPGITFYDPAEGTYDIWVGSYASDNFIDGTLYITEFDLHPGEVGNDRASTDDPDPTPGSGLVRTLPPNYGSTALSAGFLPDPHEVAMTSGGSVDVGDLNLGGSCYGFATSAPDFRLFWSGDSSEMTVTFTANDGGDTTLIINDPFGNWRCNDDFDGLNPGVVIDNPPGGQYDIWVGSYIEDSHISGTLAITEFDVSPQ